MNSLKVTKWQDLEEICCYLLSHVVSPHVGRHIEFRRYGSQGQKQFGIDLVSLDNQFPIVGQCKLMDGSFNFNMLKEELKKSDGYQNRIWHFFLCTTGKPHTSIHDLKNYVHERQDGSKFGVTVLYWDEIKDLSFLPLDVSKRIFPDAEKLHAPAFVDQTRQNYLLSLEVMKTNVPKWIGINNLTWLENWDFSLGYVKQVDFDPFFNLSIEYHRTSAALTGQIHEWLHEGDRQLIARCLPAAQRFFNALCDFKAAITDVIIGQTVEGVDILTIQDFPKSDQQKITRTWQSSADYLALVYKQDVLGKNVY